MFSYRPGRETCRLGVRKQCSNIRRVLWNLVHCVACGYFLSTSIRNYHLGYHFPLPPPLFFGFLDEAVTAILFSEEKDKKKLSQQYIFACATVVRTPLLPVGLPPPGLPISARRAVPPSPAAIPRVFLFEVDTKHTPQQQKQWTNFPERVAQSSPGRTMLLTGCAKIARTPAGRGVVLSLNS